MSRCTTVIPSRQPDVIEDPLTEVAREGARRMLAQVLIAEADAFVALWKEIAGRPRPHRASRPWTAARHPDWGWTCRGPARQGARPGRRCRGGENSLHLVDPAEVGATDEESRRAVPVLYMRGVSTGDFQEALTALLGKDAPCL